VRYLFGMPPACAYRRLIASFGLALLAAVARSQPTPTPTPKPAPVPTPTTYELLLDVENRAVDESARDKNIVIGIEVTDTKEGFTIELAGGKIDVREGLPPRAVAVLSGRRSIVEKIMKGSETLSGAIRANLVDVQGDLDKILELLDCCIHRRS
jgi:alkyl sulfatase BDS1-like metallo-beta-lactamase superfamily hydrolase